MKILNSIVLLGLLFVNSCASIRSPDFAVRRDQTMFEYRGMYREEAAHLDSMPEQSPEFWWSIASDKSQPLYKRRLYITQFFKRYAHGQMAIEDLVKLMPNSGWITHEKIFSIKEEWENGFSLHFSAGESAYRLNLFPGAFQPGVVVSFEIDGKTTKKEFKRMLAGEETALAKQRRFTSVRVDDLITF